MRTEKSKNGDKLILLGKDSGFLYSFLVVSAILCSLVFSTVLTLVSKNDASVFLSDGVIILNYVISPIATCIAIGVLRYKRKSSFMVAELNRKFKPIPLVSAILIFIGINFALSEVNAYFVNWLTTLGLEVSSPTLPSKNAGNIILVIIYVSIIPALVEEYAFRGVIVNGLKSTGNAFAILASGALFSLFHMSPAQTVYQFIVGCLFSTIILYGGNIWYVIAMHFFNNLYVVLNYYFWGFEITGALEYVLMAVGVICLVAGVLLLVKKGDKEIELSQEFKKLNRSEFFFGASLGILISAVTWIVSLVM